MIESEFHTALTASKLKHHRPGEMHESKPDDPNIQSVGQCNTGDIESGNNQINNLSNIVDQQPPPVRPIRRNRTLSELITDGNSINSNSDLPDMNNHAQIMIKSIDEHQLGLPFNTSARTPVDDQNNPAGIQPFQLNGVNQINDTDFMHTDNRIDFEVSTNLLSGYCIALQ